MMSKNNFNIAETPNRWSTNTDCVHAWRCFARNMWAWLGVITFVVQASGIACHAHTSRPNIVVIVVDDLRWDELGCAGHPFVNTPHIDRIANEGVRFRNAFCTAVLCSPSRASILTGQYVHRHGIVDNTERSAASHQLVTFPRLLRDAGYATGFVGKWHMGNDATPRPGFSDWFCLPGQGSSVDPLVNENGQSVAHTGYTTDVLNEHVVEFIKLNQKSPFCLFIAHKALHPETIQFADGSLSDPSAARFIPAERHNSLYVDCPVPRRLSVLDSLTGKPALRQPIANVKPLGRDTGTSDESVRERLRMLAAVDEGVGRLFTVLSAIGQLDNTVIVFTSDHGYWYGEHGLSVERRLAYEEGIRIPLLIRFPKAPAVSNLIDHMVLGIDIAPTVLEFAKVSNKLNGDGASLLPLFSDSASAQWRRSFLIEYASDTVFPRMHKLGYRAVRTENWKYIRYLEQSGMDELYDLVRDPYEMNNLISTPAGQFQLSFLADEMTRLSGGNSR